jgi:hypothetical protein
MTGASQSFRFTWRVLDNDVGASSTVQLEQLLTVFLPQQENTFDGAAYPYSETVVKPEVRSLKFPEFVLRCTPCPWVVVIPMEPKGPNLAREIFPSSP